MKIKILLFLIYCLSMSGLQAQTNTSQTLFLPFEMGQKRQGKAYEQELMFWAYPFQGSSLDLRDFKRMTPGYEGSDRLSIVAPDLSSFENPTVLLSLIGGSDKTEDALIVILAGNYETENVTFFIDKKLSRDFVSGVEIKQLNVKDEAYQVLIEPKNKAVPSQKLWLKVPPVKRTNTKVDATRPSASKTRILNQFALAAQAGIGVGDLNYVFDDIDRGFPTWYDVNYVEKNIGLTFSHNSTRFRLALSGNYQNLYYYTSYLNIRTDEPKLISPGVVRENVNVRSNGDRHDVHQFNYMLTAGVRFYVSSTVEIQPFASYGRVHYQSGRYLPNRFEEDSAYELPPSTFFEGGLRFEFVVGNKKGLFLDLMYHQNTWRPVGYFERFQYENLDLNSSVWKGNIGYRLGF